MAEDKVELREINYRQVLPWTELFKGFQLALDPKKLLLAAAGIVVMYLGWVFLSWIFFSSRKEPLESDIGLYAQSYLKSGVSEPDATRLAKQEYERERYKWELLYQTAGPGGKL